MGFDWLVVFVNIECSVSQRFFCASECIERGRGRKKSGEGYHTRNSLA